ncbi:MAG TPA: RNA polymerase sigma factor [Burkholderiaceae bacterium]
MPAAPPAVAPPSPLDALTPVLRRQLHRHCARMTGSFFDGEDVLQDALLKAHEAATALSAPIANPGGWLFRIAHHAALDRLRQRRRDPVTFDADTDVGADAGEPASAAEVSDAERRWAVHASLRTFVQLPPLQRGTVILADVLGYSLEEVAEIIDRSLTATKSALFRGRRRLEALAAQPAQAAEPAPLETEHVALVKAYAELFNGRHFDALRDLLAQDIRVELVGAAVLEGRELVTSRYFGNYSATAGWQAQAVRVDGEPALVVRQAGRPSYFIAFGPSSAGVLHKLRDFRHAGYDVEGADVQSL